MKHFAVKYISPLGFGRASLCQECPAVIIAKYYEGAYLNGTIAINNTPAQFVQAVIYDEFGIPHDNVLTDDQGKFNLLIPGGNITLRLSYANQVILKDITFNSTKYPPISDDEAMRRVDDFTRELNLSIPLSTLDGYVYEDVDGDGKYNLQNDTPLSGVVLELTDEFGLHPSPESVTTDDTGYYSFDGLFPSKYTLTAIEDGFELYSESITIEPENKTINISKPMLGGITGVVYFDEDMDEDYDEGTEEMSDVAVNLIYGRTNEVVGTQTTDASGFFSFSQLIPGDYIINASKMNPATGYLDYFVEDDVTIQPNATIEANLSIGYATIKVSGVTQHSGQLLGSIPITFEADPTDMVNNTAEDAQATSKSDGSYEVELIPGDYNVYVEYSDDQLGTYSFVDTLTLTMGQGVYSYLIGLEKETVSVDGVLTAAGHPVANLTIDFIPVIEQDNTAVRADTQADATGSYHIELMPGAYNVTIDKVVNESGTNVHYTIIDRLDIDLADDPFTYDIMVTREIQ